MTNQNTSPPWPVTSYVPITVRVRDDKIESIAPGNLKMMPYSNINLRFTIKQDYPPGQGWQFPNIWGINGFYNGFKAKDDPKLREFFGAFREGPNYESLLVTDRNSDNHKYDYTLMLTFWNWKKRPIYSDPSIQNVSDG